MLQPTQGKLKPLARCGKPFNIKSDDHKIKRTAFPIPDKDPQFPQYLCVLVTYYKNKIADVGIWQCVPELTAEQIEEERRIQQAVDDAVRSLEEMENQAPTQINFSTLDDVT